MKVRFTLSDFLFSDYLNFKEKQTLHLFVNFLPLDKTICLDYICYYFQVRNVFLLEKGYYCWITVLLLVFIGEYINTR